MNETIEVHHQIANVKNRGEVLQLKNRNHTRRIKKKRNPIRRAAKSRKIKRTKSTRRRNRAKSIRSIRQARVAATAIAVAQRPAHHLNLFDSLTCSASVRNVKMNKNENRSQIKRAYRFVRITEYFV